MDVRGSIYLSQILDRHPRFGGPERSELIIIDTVRRNAMSAIGMDFMEASIRNRRDGRSHDADSKKAVES
jgi:hypothetical protein